MKKKKKKKEEHTFKKKIRNICRIADTSFEIFLTGTDLFAPFISQMSFPI